MPFYKATYDPTLGTRILQSISAHLFNVYLARLRCLRQNQILEKKQECAQKLHQTSALQSSVFVYLFTSTDTSYFHLFFNCEIQNLDLNEVEELDLNRPQQIFLNRSDLLLISLPDCTTGVVCAVPRRLSISFKDLEMPRCLFVFCSIYCTYLPICPEPGITQCKSDI